MMKLRPITCPKCGGNIRVPIEERQCFCTFCGTQLFIDDGSKTVTYRTVDEARIREADAREALALKVLEIKEAKRKSRLTILKVIAIAAGALFVLALIVGRSDVSIGYMLGAVAGILLMYGAIFVFIKSDDDDDGLDANYIGGVQVGCSAHECKGQRFEAIEAQLRRRGFTDIECIPLHDINALSGLLLREGAIDEVSIDGDTDFESKAWFPPDVKVVITYHSNRESQPGRH